MTHSFLLELRKIRTKVNSECRWKSISTKYLPKRLSYRFPTLKILEIKICFTNTLKKNWCHHRVYFTMGTCTGWREKGCYRSSSTDVHYSLDNVWLPNTGFKYTTLHRMGLSCYNPPIQKPSLFRHSPQGYLPYSREYFTPVSRSSGRKGYTSMSYFNRWTSGLLLGVLLRRYERGNWVWTSKLSTLLI